MLNKSILILSALAFIASTQGAFAQSKGIANQAAITDVAEQKIADRYPFLEPGVAKVALGRTARVALTQAVNPAEIAEHKLSDLYPFLAPGAVMNARLQAKAGSQSLGNVETPEHKLSDRYPFLDRNYAQRGKGMIIAVRMQKHA